VVSLSLSPGRAGRCHCRRFVAVGAGLVVMACIHSGRSRPFVCLPPQIPDISVSIAIFHPWFSPLGPIDLHGVVCAGTVAFVLVLSCRLSAGAHRVHQDCVGDGHRLRGDGLHRLFRAASPHPCQQHPYWCVRVPFLALMASCSAFVSRLVVVYFCFLVFVREDVVCCLCAHCVVVRMSTVDCMRGVHERDVQQMY